MAKPERFLRFEDVTIKRSTEKAVLIVTETPDGKPVEIWLPKSQIKETDCLADNDTGYVVVTEWIAKQKGLLSEDD